MALLSDLVCKESASTAFDVQTFCFLGQDVEHHEALRTIGHEGGGLVAIDVAIGVRAGFGPQHRLGRNGNPRTCACTGLGTCDAVRWGAVCQPERAELDLEGRLISKALMISRSALAFGVLHCKLFMAISCIYPGIRSMADGERRKLRGMRHECAPNSMTGKFPGLVSHYTTPSDVQSAGK
jgi:hypothetical protein